MNQFSLTAQPPGREEGSMQHVANKLQEIVRQIQMWAAMW